MADFIKGTLYTCECGYKTTSPNQACKHSKTIKCKERNMEKRDVEFVLKEDYLASIGNVSPTNITVPGDHNTVVGTQNITINLTVPDKSVVLSIYDAVKNRECIDEIRGADPQQIPAILFKYTRGTKAEQKVIQFDADKNLVRHKDPITGKEVAKDLKKYRNEYLAKNADVYDDDYHIPYMPREVQRSMKDLSAPIYDTGKKKEKQIPAAKIIKMCATGDHKMYKLPEESKQFYTDVAENVDNEIKSTV
ncbi:protein of unknown function (DUF1390) [Paramecium bursaria Chlorella virus Fr5L]|nr:protein of unknown function (DUF1390) [Paramecium bursaria Chlorella virus Fr5L]